RLQAAFACNDREEDESAAWLPAETKPPKGGTTNSRNYELRDSQFAAQLVQVAAQFVGRLLEAVAQVGQLRLALGQLLTQALDRTLQCGDGICGTCRRGGWRGRRCWRGRRSNRAGRFTRRRLRDAFACSAV